MVLAQPQEANARLIGQFGQLDDVLQPLLGRLGEACFFVSREFTKSEDTEVHIS